MKFCQPHWDKLRTAIEGAGMSGLIAADGEAAALRMKYELEGIADDSTFDPLMAAHNAIVEQFMKPLGPNALYIFTGDYCPLCELVRMNPRPPEAQPIDENWVMGVTRDLAEYCKQKNLL